MINNGIRPIVLSCSDDGVGSKSIDTVNEVLDLLEKGREHLKRWTITFEKKYPEQEHEIPLEINLTIKNFTKEVGTTDSCNQAYELRRLVFGEAEKTTMSVEKDTLQWIN